MTIDDDLLAACAASFDDVPDFLSDAVFHDDDPARALVLAALAAVNAADASAAADEKMFQFTSSRLSPAERELAARIKVLAPALTRKILTARRDRLCDVTAIRPAPYEHAALADIPIDDDHLAPLTAFENDCNTPVRNGYRFTLTPALPAACSSYWSWASLGRLPRADVTISFRPDPLAFQPATSMRVPFYKMLVYGRALDWQRIGRLHAEEHVRWQPDDAEGDDVPFTEVSWTPRDDGIHVAMEELPKLANCDVQAARYLHGIYDPASESFKHCDGAVRFYEAEELAERRSTRLGKAGKAGVRVKLWKVDGKFARDAWTGLASSFFVWNDDVRRYVGGDGV